VTAWLIPLNQVILIFVDISINEFDGDGIYVFGFDDKIYVKRLQMIPDKILVISDNLNIRSGQWISPMKTDFTFSAR
jgi:hypothetical protein